MEQVISAIEIGRSTLPERVFYDYDHIRPTHIASVLSHAAPYYTYCHPEILKLVEYDRVHGTSLSQVLYLYLLYPKEPSVVYRTLHIHKNTLYARLEKIQSIIDVDLNSGSFIAQANLTYLLLQENHRLS